MVDQIINSIHKNVLSIIETELIILLPVWYIKLFTKYPKVAKVISKYYLRLRLTEQPDRLHTSTKYQVYIRGKLCREFVIKQDMHISA